MTLGRRLEAGQHRRRCRSGRLRRCGSYAGRAGASLGRSDGRDWGRDTVSGGGRHRRPPAREAVELLGKEETLGQRLPAAIGEEPPPCVGYGQGVPGVLLEHRLGVGGVLAVEEWLVHVVDYHPGRGFACRSAAG
jgi:hypothetical protein